MTLKNGWYTDSASQQQYRKYVATVINRYKSSSAILSWELINEPRCTGCPTSTITKWATETSAYVKSLDATHLVALGDEGFINAGGSYAYSTAEGIDFEANLKIPVSSKSSSTIPFGANVCLVYRCRHLSPLQ